MAKKRGNNEGSIYKRKGGKWRAQVNINGKRLSYTGNTYNECKKWLFETKKKIETGLTYDNANLSYKDFLNNWLTSIQSTLRPKTWDQYRQITYDYIIPNLGLLKIAELRPNQIQSLYTNKINEGKGLRTVQFIHSVIRRSLNHAVKLSIMHYNPANATTPPKPISKEMDILDDTQVQLLILTAKRLNDNYLALYQLAVTTGMRQGELLGLKWEDINWSKKTINVKRQIYRKIGGGLGFSSPKTKAGIRNLAIGSRTIKILHDHYNLQLIQIGVIGEKWQNHDLIFPSNIGTPFHPKNQYRRFKKLLSLAGLPDIRFHDLRHTAASLMLNSGIPVLVVSKRLGHAKPSITLDVYGHLIPSMQEEIADLIDELISPIEVTDLSLVAPGLHREN